MRTIKALACAAALAAGIATSLAQSNVYSLNVVGYYNLPCTSGTFYCIANQLNTTNNAIVALIPTPPPGSILYKWYGSWIQNQADPETGEWQTPLDTLAPGEAALFKATANTTLTFVGEVLQGNGLQGGLALNAYGGTTAKSSVVPQAGAVSSVLEFPKEAGDYVYKWEGTWIGYQVDPEDAGSWLSGEPTFAVGEGMLVRKAAASTITAWTRNFTVQ